MKKSFTKLILGICSLILTPTAAYAKYNSIDELFKAFGKAGFEQVMEMPSNDFSTGGPNIKVHEVDTNGIHQTETLSQGKRIRMSDLDYVYNSKAALSKLVSGQVYAQAYQVGEVLLCYTVESGLHVNSGKQLSCYLFPTRISEVVKAIKSL